MGVSFKISKAGKRYRPKPLLVEDKDCENVTPTDPQQTTNEGFFVGVEDKDTDHLKPVSEDLEVSVSLNLFPDGFSIGKATELYNDVPKLLHPYDRASKPLFSAIEYGRVPGDFFDDIPCKYVNGNLLCEIRDYRNCLKKGDATASAYRSPTVQKVLLQMSMENVVKDISSISDDSWTYEDLLEVESRVLKALQPDLHLNPRRVLSRVSGEPMTRKINLEIAWSWKRRKLSDAQVTNPVFSNQLHETEIPGIGLTHNSNPRYNQAFQGSGVTCIQQTIPSSAPSSRGKNVVQETILQSFPLPMQSNNYQSALGCNQIASTALIRSNALALKQNCSNNYHDLKSSSSLVLGDRDRCEVQAIQRSIIHKPKKEPQDFSQPQFLGSQAETIYAIDLQCKSNPVQQRLEADKILHGRFQQQAILEGGAKLQAGVGTSSVKQEPPESSNIHSSDLEKMGVCQPMARKGTRTPKRKALQNPIVSSRLGSASISSCYSDFAPRGASLLAKRKSFFHPEGSSMNLVRYNSNMNGVGGEHGSLVENLSLPQSNMDDPILHKFSKIKEATQRFGLNRRKPKLNKFSSKPFSCKTPLVAFHLLNSEDNRNSKYNPSSSFLDRSLDVSKTRTLTFVPQGNGIRNCESRKKLIISEKLNERIVGASVLYGDENEMDSTNCFLSPAFPNTKQYADLFAAQFTSLMVREGYQLLSDEIKHNTPCTDGGKRSSTVYPSIPIPGSSPNMPSPMNGVMSSQLLSRNIISGGHALPFQSVLQSKALYDVPTQLNAVQQQWLRTINTQRVLEFQMQQRRREREMLERKLMVEGFGGLGMLSGLGNLGLGSLGNNMGPMPLSFGNMVSPGNLTGNALSFGGSRRPLMRSTGAFPIQRPSIPDMVFNMTHQQLPPQVRVPVPLQLPEAASSLVSPKSDVISQHFDPQALLLSSVVQQGMNVGNVAAGPETSHGSINSSNASSSLALVGVVKEGCVFQTGGVKQE